MVFAIFSLLYALLFNNFLVRFVYIWVTKLEFCIDEYNKVTKFPSRPGFPQPPRKSPRRREVLPVFYTSFKGILHVRKAVEQV